MPHVSFCWHLIPLSSSICPLSVKNPLLKSISQWEGEPSFPTPASSLIPSDSSGKIPLPQKDNSCWDNILSVSQPYYQSWFEHDLILFYFFKFKFIYFNWRLITLQYCISFAIHQHESATGIHVFPIPNPLSLLPHCTISLGHPSAPAQSILYPALNLDWQFVSYMILYMFQCHSPKSPPLLPQSLKDCSIHLCLFCCLA